MLTKHAHTNRRSGIVLLVVMAMLALFAVVALSFVYYAEAEATASRYAAQAQTQAQADVDPELLLSYYLSQLIYDTNNVYSAMRGHSLARNMYGYNTLDWNVTPFNGVGRQRYQVTYTSAEPNSTVTPGSAQRDNMFLINYQNFGGSPTPPRNPETDQNGKYVAGNVHWTYPDLNNMFLAAVTGNGDVLIPSFYRPWVPLGRQGDPWNKFLSLRPDGGPGTYNPEFSPPDWDGGGDVKNLEWGNGTVLASGGQVNNDSIWMDLGFGVLTAPNGKRYKPLFAGLVVDLDNKINLYMHGNIMNNAGYGANMGYGPWEVDLSGVLSALPPPNPLAPPQRAQEWQNLFHGPAGSAIARYGADPTAQPDGSTAALAPFLNPLYNNKAAALATAGPPNLFKNIYTPQPPPYYSKIDFGGITQTPGAIQYPTGVPPFMLQTYPIYQQETAAGWDNGTLAETLNHPAGYTPFVPTTRNRAALVMSQIEALYRFQGTGAPAMTSDLLAQLQQNMQNPKTRWLSTLRSMDLDRPGLAPFNALNLAQPSPLSTFRFPNSPTTQPYPTIPAAGAIYSPGNNTIPATPAEIKSPPVGFTPAGGEFDLSIGRSSWRSSVYNKSASPNGIPSPNLNPNNNINNYNQWRVALNRDLTPYPDPYAYPYLTPPPAGSTVPVLPPVAPPAAPSAAYTAYIKAVTAAVKDRTDMAQELYAMLIQITGARDPNVPANAGMNTTPTGLPEYQAARWLAQLAVNIVDFIDEDDYMTPFAWNKNAPTDIVFGTELAHLVLNEVYSQLDNNADDPSVWAVAPAVPRATKAFRANFWIELHNPTRNLALTIPPQGIAPFSTPPVGVVSPATFPRYGGRAHLSEYRVVVTPTTGISGANFTNSQSTTVQNFFNTVQPEQPLPPSLTTPLQSVPSVSASPAPAQNSLTGTDTTKPPTASFTNLQFVDPIIPTSAYGTTNTANQGFYVLGPDPPPGTVAALNLNKQYLPNRDPALPVSQDSGGKKALFPELSLPVPLAQYNNGVGQGPYGVFLQRLANPSLPYQNNPSPTASMSPYNPYVTIDYWDAINNVDNSTDSQGNFRYSGTGVIPPSALHSNIVYTQGGAVSPVPPLPKDTTSTTPRVFVPWRSMGKRQPYVGLTAKWSPTKLTRPPSPVTGPQNTFFTHNGQTGSPSQFDQGLDVPFYWPVHLDRRLVNPLELLNVSCYRPWDYTQRFGTTGGDHRSPWEAGSPWGGDSLSQSSTLIYRLLEMVQTSRFISPLQTGGNAPPPGNLPGKINVNTIWDPEILAAVMNNPNVNTVQITGVPTIFKTFLDSRSPGLSYQFPPVAGVPRIGTPGPKAVGVIGPTDDIKQSEVSPIYKLNFPFKSMNVGVYSGTDLQHPNGMGIANTLLRQVPDNVGPGATGWNRSLFRLPDRPTPPIMPYTLPFRNYAALSSMYNNLTLRSNVFAVWLTVGFFEVTDESVYPVRIGKEIGRSENRHVRHRMFAVIDRTNLMAPSMLTTLTTPAKPGLQTVSVANDVTNFTLQFPGQVKVKGNSIVAGMNLAVYDQPYDPTKPPNDMVLVSAANLNQITGIFSKAHNIGAVIVPYTSVPPVPGPTSIGLSVLGNPGPQDGYFDVRQNTLVVPHFSIIQ